jgi:hypothetical protein
MGQRRKRRWLLAAIAAPGAPKRGVSAGCIERTGTDGARLRARWQLAHLVSVAAGASQLMTAPDRAWFADEILS